MSTLYVSADVFSNSLAFIDRTVEDWSVNAQAEIYSFPDADITVVTKDFDIYLMSRRETFRKKVPFIPLVIDTNAVGVGRDSSGDGNVLTDGDAEVDFMNAILAATTS